MDRILLFSVKICDVDTRKEYTIFSPTQKERDPVLIKKCQEPSRVAQESMMAKGSSRGIRLTGLRPSRCAAVALLWQGH